VGNGMKIRFPEDICLGTAQLIHEKNKIVADIWDGNECRLTFRTFSQPLLQRWFELLVVASSICLSEIQTLFFMMKNTNSLAWHFDELGIYSSQFFYGAISYRFVTTIYIPSIWNIEVPPKVQLLLWLMAYNKLMILDNPKIGVEKPPCCQFCDKRKTIRLIFF
jgi:hypothetical protein